MTDKKGTQRNHLKLTLDKVSRPLLQEFIEKENFDFRNEPSTGDNLFLLNIVGNEFLSKMAIRVAIFLHEYFQSKEEVEVDDESDDDFYLTHGEMFMTCMPESKLSLEIEAGDDYDELCFYVNYKGLSIGYDLPFPNLVTLLSEGGLETSSSNLNKALVELHSFHYITLTPAPPSERQLNDKKRVRQPWRHIRLYRGMCDKSFYQHLYNIERPKRKR